MDPFLSPSQAIAPPPEPKRDRKKYWLVGLMMVLMMAMLSGSIEALEGKNFIAGNILEQSGAEEVIAAPDAALNTPIIDETAAPPTEPIKNLLSSETIPSAEESSEESPPALQTSIDGTDFPPAETVENPPLSETAPDTSENQTEEIQEAQQEKDPEPEKPEEEEENTSPKESPRERLLNKNREKQAEQESKILDENEEKKPETEEQHLQPTRPLEEQPASLPQEGSQAPTIPESFLPPALEEHSNPKEKAIKNIDDMGHAEKIAYCSTLEGRMLLFSHDSIIENAVQITHELDDQSCPAFCREEIFFDLDPKRREDGKCKRVRSGCNAGGDDGVKFHTEESCESYYEEKVLTGMFGTPKERVDLENIKKEIHEKYRNLKNACLIQGVSECLADKRRQNNATPQCLENYILPCFDWDAYIETVLSSYSFKALQQIGNEVLQWKEEQLRGPPPK